MSFSAPAGWPAPYDAVMAYDERLAERVRGLISDGPAVAEQKMFGGLGFMIGGNLAVAASSDGGLMVRVDPEQTDAIAAGTAAEPMVMRGRPMKGWLRLRAADVAVDADLAAWVDRGITYAAGLPPK